MLYGNIIFIKKTGGDGSKFPVTERDIKIGRSEDCLIRIYNSQIAPVHCQLIIGDNGQATLRNMSNQTILNGKPLGQEDVTLCHGDVFQLGERLARWEYLSTSKYYRQLLSPTGRLVAVVMPQQRSLEEQVTPGTSASQVSVLKDTSLGKRRFSERVTSENSSSVKIRKSSGNELLRKVKGDLPKLLTGRHSLKATKFLLHGTKAKERKSMSGVSSKTPKRKIIEKSRKSTLPSWKVNIVSPEQKSPGSRTPIIKSSKKLAKSPKSKKRISLKDVIEPSSKNILLSDSKSGLRKEQNMMNSSEVSVKSASKGVSKTPLKPTAESPSKGDVRSVRSTRSFSKSPSPKKNSPKRRSKIVLSTPKQRSPKLGRLVHSESKINSHVGKQASKGTKRMSLILEKIDSISEGTINKKLSENVSVRKVSEGIFDNALQTPVKEKQTRKSVKGTPKIKTPGKTSRKSVKSPTQVKTPRKSVIIKARESLNQNSKTPVDIPMKEVGPDAVKTPLLIDFDSELTPKKVKYTPLKSPKTSSVQKTSRKLQTSARKSPASASRKISNRLSENISSASFASEISTPKSSTTPRKPVKEKSSLSTSKTGVTSPRGVRRKLSPSSSAERAAKMLKTSNPKKPDKNKKAALLVLGKANRKQLLSQNVLLKHKIVKKAIKQSQKVDSNKKTVVKLNKKIKKAVKPKRKPSKKGKSGEKQSPTKDVAVKSPVNTKSQEGSSKSKTLETSQSSPLKVPVTQRLSSKFKPTENSLSDQNIESSHSVSSSPFGIFEQAAESYMFNSNRRSKRLSSKNDTGRPDFIELSPTALGLMPKHINVFKTPKESKRRSSSLATPKNIRTTGIIKSASTSKIGNRKSVRFSPKDVYNSEFYTPYTAEKVDFDFSSIHTPDVTVDVFVSPLTDNSTKKDLNEKIALGMEEIPKTSSTKVERNNTEPKGCVRKLLQSPQSKKVSPTKKSSRKTQEMTSSKNNSDDLKGVRQLFATPKPKKSLKNDLTDVKGVKKLFQTPKQQKSPKNDLTDLKGVKKLLTTPKLQKSPKNDLTDLRGVKKLLTTPKQQKGPKNDLTDLKGVKKLLTTPKQQKSPKNDLTDLRGVKKLLGSPKVPKSPKNDLSDVRGVKKLLTTPKLQKSPKNDLTDLRGVKKLLATPKLQKSPKNDLTDLRGVKKLLGSPRIPKSPKNDLSDVRGVKKLLTTPRAQKSPKNNLLEVSGIGNLFESPMILSKESTTGVKQLLISKTTESVLNSQKKDFRKPHVKDFKAIRGRRMIYSTPKGPKNDLSDVTGVRELFSRHKPISDYNISMTGVAELFDLSEVVTKEKPARKSAAPKTLRFKKESESEGDTIVTRRGRTRKAPEEETEKKQTRSGKTALKVEEEKPLKRKAVSEKASVVTKKSKKEETKTKSRGRKEAVVAEEVNENKTSRKRKASTENAEASPPKSKRKLPVAKKTVSKGTSKRVATRSAKGTSSKEDVKEKSTKKSSTKSKETSTATKVQLKSAIKADTKTVQKVQSRSQSSSKTASNSETEMSPRKTRGAKTTRVNKTAPSKVSKAKSKSVGKKTVKSTAGRSKSSPVAKRSTRRTGVKKD